jgi:hypothetical protein
MTMDAEVKKFKNNLIYLLFFVTLGLVSLCLNLYGKDSINEAARAVKELGYSGFTYRDLDFENCEGQIGFVFEGLDKNSDTRSIIACKNAGLWEVKGDRKK